MADPGGHLASESRARKRHLSVVDTETDEWVALPLRHPRAGAPEIDRGQVDDALFEAQLAFDRVRALLQARPRLFVTDPESQAVDLSATTYQKLSMLVEAGESIAEVIDELAEGALRRRQSAYIDELLVRGYEKIPAEATVSRAAARRLIADEPW
jgi:hypothetical protein